MTDLVQAAVDEAVGTPGVLYPEGDRVYDLELFRSRVVESLAAHKLCAAWDWGNELGDELYVRSADGCVTEQYDLLTGGGGVRPATGAALRWREGWDVPPPPAKPQFSKEGDVTCSLPGDRATFCTSIKSTPGEYGTDMYQVITQVIEENPGLVDKNDFVGGQGSLDPDGLRIPAWRITNQDAYIAAVEKKLRSRGYCGFIEKGDILKVKKVSRGNIFHEEIDVVQNPESGGSFVLFAIKDRCHNAGF